MKRFPNAEIVLTLGEQGAMYLKGDRCIFQRAYRVEAVDTTAAGDTFTGYYLAEEFSRCQWKKRWIWLQKHLQLRFQEKEQHRQFQVEMR